MSSEALLCIVLGAAIAQSASLASTYNTNITLSDTTNAYTIDSDVYIESGATLTVGNNVELVFTGEYRIIVRGRIDVGCNDPSFDTFNFDANVGLMLGDKAHIHSNAGRQGRFYFDGMNANPIGLFCNVLFQNLETAVEIYYRQALVTIDNCEFSDMGVVFRLPNQYGGVDRSLITDSWIHDVDAVLVGGHAEFDNNQFIDFTRFIGSTAGYAGVRLKVYNNVLTASPFMNTTCIPMLQYSDFINNTLSNCDIGIVLWYNRQNTMKFNTITRCNVAIEIIESTIVYSTDVVQYNNFIDNAINIRCSVNKPITHINYNYHNTTFIADKIQDICSGYNYGIVQYWPYFTEKIDFDDISSSAIAISNGSDIDLQSCNVSDNGHTVSGSILKTVYKQNTTLDVLNSPYYVTHNIAIAEKVIVNVENGVEIVFLGDYVCAVYGIINAGCNILDHSGYDNHIGLYNDTQSTYIHSDDLSQKGRFYFFVKGFDSQVDINRGQGYFCNVLFDGLFNAVDVEQKTNTYGVHDIMIVTMDNCEIRNVYSALQLAVTQEAMQSVVTDCYIHNATNILSAVNAIFDHNLVEDFSVFLATGRGYSGRSVYIYNNIITGRRVDTCVEMLARSEFINNTLSNCIVGIVMNNVLDTYVNVIKYNTFSNCDVAIDIKCTRTSGIVQYNNFINNDINLQSSTDKNQEGFTYNYYGFNNSDNQTAIASKIRDICDGINNGLITWWPYFIRPIDAYDSNNNIKTIDELECRGQDNGHDTSGCTVLNVIYVTNVTLSAATYCVANDVSILVGVILEIENGATIIFKDNYKVNVFGTLNMGCLTATDTISITHKYGLYYNAKTVVYAEPVPFQGTFHFDIDSDASWPPHGLFCNVLFDALLHAVHTEQAAVYTNAKFATTNIVTIDNCEIRNMSLALNFAAPHNSAKLYSVTDSQIHHVDSVVSGGHAAIDHNEFTHFNTFITKDYGVNPGRNMTIYNNIIRGQSHTCIDNLESNSVFISNTLSNCDIGIAICISHWTDASTVKYNTIENCNTAIDVTYDSPSYGATSVIQYNNFINNSINIQNSNDINQPNFNFNYFGAFNDPFNQTEVAGKIRDRCDDWYDGIATFWPWLVAPYTDMNNLPPQHTFAIDADTDGVCDAILQPNISYIFSDKPTADPTIDPTMDPTDDPTRDPTRDPTKDPTTNPTIHPTRDPTRDPTRQPTKEPTTNPTIHPTKYPTINPTFDPSSAPTSDPSSDPSSSPSTANPSHTPAIAIETTNDEDTRRTTPLHKDWDMIGYGIVGLLFFIPFILLLFGLCFHYNRKGTDSPTYMAVVRCFTNIADLYTDMVFWITLLVTKGELIVGAIAATFTVIPHLISIVICFMQVHQWRTIQNEYVRDNDALIFVFTLLAGFYPCIDLLSSKLFHLKQTSLHLTKHQHLELKQKRFFNTILLENAPLMGVQLYVLLSGDEGEAIDPITVMALTFSSLSLIVGIMTLISRAFGNRSEQSKSDTVAYQIDIKSNAIEEKHQFVHSLFAKVLSQCLGIHSNRVETTDIIQSGGGIKITVTIALRNHDGAHLDKLISKLSFSPNDSSVNTSDDMVLRGLLVKKMALSDAAAGDLCVSIVKLKSTDGLLANALHAHVTASSVSKPEITVEMNDL